MHSAHDWTANRCRRSLPHTRLQLLANVDQRRRTVRQLVHELLKRRIILQRVGALHERGNVLALGVKGEGLVPLLPVGVIVANLCNAGSVEGSESHSRELHTRGSGKKLYCFNTCTWKQECGVSLQIRLRDLILKPDWLLRSSTVCGSMSDPRLT